MKWISFDEALPAPGEFVLLWMRDSVMAGDVDIGARTKPDRWNLHPHSRYKREDNPYTNEEIIAFYSHWSIINGPGERENE